MISHEWNKQLRGGFGLLILIGLSCFYMTIAADEDIYPPALVSADFNPKQIDISSADAQVTVTGSVTDDTGIDWIKVGFWMNVETGRSSIAVGCGEIFGNGAKQKDFSITCTFSTSYKHDGLFFLSIGVKDTVTPNANVDSYDGVSGQPLKVTHSGALSQDDDPPELLSFSFSPKSVDVASSSAVITSEVTLTDETGIDRVNVNYFSPDGQMMTGSSGCTPTSDISAKTVNFRCTGVIPLGAPSGDWTPEISFTDTLGYSMRLNQPGTVSVSGRDEVAPVIHWPPERLFEANLQGGARVVLNITVTDDKDPSPKISCHVGGWLIYDKLAGNPPYTVDLRLGTNMVGCEAEDAAGNSTGRQSITVTVQDTTPPRFVGFPQNPTRLEMTSPQGATWKASILIRVQDTHNVDRAPTWECDQDVRARLYPPGTTTVTCTTRDASGNEHNQSFDVIVADTTPPQLQVPQYTIQKEATSYEGARVTFSVTASDVIDASPTISCTPPSGSTFALGTTTVSCTATDDYGNASPSQSFSIVVFDSTPPTLSIPANKTVEATSPSGASVSFSPTAVDIADPSPTISCSHESGSTFPLGTTTVTCTATDSSGNNSSAKSFTITVRDLTPPTLTLPADILEVTTDPSGMIISFDADIRAVDAVDPSPTWSCNPASGSLFQVGTTTVSCTAADASGNTSAPGSFTITVTLDRPPILILPANMTVEAADSDGSAVSFSVSASDDFDPSPAVACNPPSGAIFSLGTTIVTCTATDSAGNSTDGSFTITVKDSTKPILVLPENITVESSDPAGIVVSFTVTATDTVDPAPDWSCNPASDSLFPIGTTTVHCTAIDSSGNSSGGSFTITVQETAPPPEEEPVFVIVSSAGTGSGRITAEGTFISCNVFPGGNVSGICNAGTSQLPADLILTATPAQGSFFEGWSGCDSTSGADSESCYVRLDAEDRYITATFQQEGEPPTLTVFGSGTGSGTSSGSGISCNVSAGGSTSGVCEIVASNPPLTVTLTANPSPQSIFVGWSGCDSTSGANNETCNLTLNLDDRGVTATFEEQERTYRLAVNGAGMGSGSISGSGINCQSTFGGTLSGICAISTTERSVTLTATASQGSLFESWSGCDSTSGVENDSCHMTLDEVDRTVTATFQQEGEPPTLTVFGSGAGSGTISGSGIACDLSRGGVTSGDCTVASTTTPFSVALTATASATSIFEGWTGCDLTSGLDNEICHLTLQLEDRSVIASFGRSGPLPILHVGGTGTGSGSVSGDGIACDIRPETQSGICTLPATEIPYSVSLSATPSPGSAFSGWDGCDSTSGAEQETCGVTLDLEDRTLVASFARIGELPVLSIMGSGTGSGTIIGQGIVCTLFPDGTSDGSCSITNIDPPLDLTLSAHPLEGSTFGGWNGCDSTSGSDNTDCHVNIQLADKTVTATFIAEEIEEPDDEGEQPPEDLPQPPDDGEESIDEGDEEEIIPRSGEECSGRTSASIILGAEIIEDCLYLRTGTYDLIVVGDPPVEARQTQGKMGFSLEDAFMFEGNPTQKVRIEIEYLDRGNDQFALAYQSVAMPPDYRYRQQSSDYARKTNSGMWKSFVYVLEDASFNFPNDGDAANGDFNLDDLSSRAIWDREDRSYFGAEIVRRVTVTLLPESGAAGLPPEDRPCHFRTSASILLGEYIEEDCLYLIGGQDRDTEAVLVGDPPTWGHRTGGGEALGDPRTNERPDHYMDFQLNDNVMFMANPSSRVYIEIEYFDQGTDTFSLFFDGVDTRDLRSGQEKENSTKFAMEVHKMDSGTWKTASIFLNDAFFGNRAWGQYDFGIDEDYGVDIIRRITVRII